MALQGLFVYAFKEPQGLRKYFMCQKKFSYMSQPVFKCDTSVQQQNENHGTWLSEKEREQERN